jgi:hypothetical protein
MGVKTRNFRIVKEQHDAVCGTARSREITFPRKHEFRVIAL